jgi:hypothetical protein
MSDACTGAFNRKLGGRQPVQAAAAPQRPLRRVGVEGLPGRPCEGRGSGGWQPHLRCRAAGVLPGTARAPRASSRATVPADAGRADCSGNPLHRCQGAVIGAIFSLESIAGGGGKLCRKVEARDESEFQAALATQGRTVTNFKQQVLRSFVAAEYLRHLVYPTAGFGYLGVSTTPASGSSKGGQFGAKNRPPPRRSAHRPGLRAARRHAAAR